MKAMYEAKSDHECAKKRNEWRNEKKNKRTSKEEINEMIQSSIKTTFAETFAEMQKAKVTKKRNRDDSDSEFDSDQEVHALEDINLDLDEVKVSEMFTCLHCDNLLIKKSKLNICLL
jgi:hypothetical protein